MDPQDAARMALELASGAQGEVIRVSGSVVAVMASLESIGALSVTVGVSATAFTVTEEGWRDVGGARALILILTPGRLAGPRKDLIPVLAKLFRDPERTQRLLKARTVDEIRSFREFMEAEVRPHLLVEDALVPVKYRVYPDTPLSEVVDLMVRRRIHAVPVVGEGYEVLGILTSGDALSYLLRLGGREGRSGRAGAAESARDFMTRTVLCVSEGQALSEAANMMVNRDVEQLPVVREGELVGFVTRDSILRALTGAPETEPDADATETERDA